MPRGGCVHFLTSTDGNTNVAFTEDVLKRFEAYGWHTQWVQKGDDDLGAMEAAIKKAQEVKDKPSVIKLTTTIGFGSKEQGTHGVHGNALKADDIQQIKQKFGFSHEQTFVVPQEVYDLYHKKASEGAAVEQQWNDLLSKYGQQFPDLHKDLVRRMSGSLPEGWQTALPTYKPTDSAVASRKLSEAVLNAIHDKVPELISGSADLTGSNNTIWKVSIYRDLMVWHIVLIGIFERAPKSFSRHRLASVTTTVATYVMV